MNTKELSQQMPVSEEDEISLIDFLAILIRHRKLIFVITTMITLMVIIFCGLSLIINPEKSYMPNMFTPKATMLVLSSGSSGLSSLLGSDTSNLASLAGISIGGGKSNGQLAILLAKSNSTINELNDSFDFMLRYRIKPNHKDILRKAILKQFSVNYDEQTATLSISFTDRDPGFAQLVVNKTVAILDRRFSSLGGSKALETRNRLEKKISDVNLQINALETKVKDFTIKYDVLDMNAMVTEQVTLLARLRSELIMKDMEIENYQKFTIIDDPVIRRIKSERESLQAQIDSIEKGNSMLPSQKQIPSISFEYAELKRDLMVQEEMLKLLTQQYEVAKFNAESQAPTFQVLELADLPDQKSGPSRALIVILASLTALFFSVVLSFVMEGISNVRKNPVAMKKLMF